MYLRIYVMVKTAWKLELSKRTVVGCSVLLGRDSSSALYRKFREVGRCEICHDSKYSSGGDARFG
ncbi:hypothetical protein [Rubritalea tangerina]|uniref:hypothetical protein n=1 Tax=Rubritalea tangerina TaxID=430798 RepID=UPI003616E4D6